MFGASQGNPYDRELAGRTDHGRGGCWRRARAGRVGGRSCSGELVMGTRGGARVGMEGGGWEVRNEVVVEMASFTGVLPGTRNEDLGCPPMHPRRSDSSHVRGLRMGRVERTTVSGGRWAQASMRSVLAEESCDEVW